jgi:hypothetical protein
VPSVTSGFKELRNQWVTAIGELVGKKKRAALARDSGLNRNSLDSWLSPGGTALPDPSGEGDRLHEYLGASASVRQLLVDAWDARPARQGTQHSELSRMVSGDWIQEIGFEPVYWEGLKWGRNSGRATQPTIDAVSVQPLRKGQDEVRGEISRLEPDDSPTTHWIFDGQLYLDGAWTLYLHFEETEGQFSRGLIVITVSGRDASYLSGLYVGRHFAFEATPAERPFDEIHIDKTKVTRSSSVHTQVIVPRLVSWRRP